MDIRLAMLYMSSMLAADDTLTSNSVCVSLGLAFFCVLSTRSFISFFSFYNLQSGVWSQ